MSHKTLVPLPPKRITYKKGPHGTKYVYYTLRSYRNQQGKPTTDEKSIGKLDPETGMLIPNKNFYELFPKYLSDTIASPQSALHVGYFEAFLKVSASIGLDAMLQEVFGERTPKILSLAAFMTAEGNVMSDYSDWIHLVSDQFDYSLSSQQISQFFTQITETERLAFFERWSNKAIEEEYIAYDVTSMSTYSQSIEKAEWGYNRDGEFLPQVNLGLFYGEKTRTPLFYSVYSGSLVDKVYLPYMMALSQKINMEKIRFVMDQGFVTQANIQTIVNEHHRVLTLLPKHFTLYKTILAEKSGQTHSFKDWLANLGVYAYTVHTKMGEVPVTVHLYFDAAWAQFQEFNLFNRIKQEETQLLALQKQKKIKPSQQKYFSIDMNHLNDFTFTIDYEKIDQIKQTFGYFALLSTDTTLNAEETLIIYRQKDVIEKCFAQLKNGMDYQSLIEHSQQTLAGKLFIAFIGLIVRNEFMNRLKADEATQSLSLKKAIKELNNIEEIQLNNGTKSRIPLTKIQKQILSALKIK